MKIYHSTSPEKLIGCSVAVGWCIQHIPLFEYRLIEAEALEDVPSFAVISSSKTVDWLVQYPERLTQLQGITFYVVGKQTKLRLEELGCCVGNYSAGGMRDLIPMVPMGRGVFLGGDNIVQSTADWLLTRPDVQRVVCYERITLPDPHIHWDVTAIYFLTSPSIVRRYAQMDMPRNVRIIVLGASSMDTALELGYENIETSPVANIQETIQWIQSSVHLCSSGP